MESAESGMELARGAVWNHHEVMYGIKTEEEKKNAAYQLMPYPTESGFLTR